MLVFPFPLRSVPPGVELLVEIEADSVRLARGPDELVVEGFWLAADGTEVDRDPVGVSAVTTRGDRAPVRFTKRRCHLPGATWPSVRVGTLASRP
jgi:hypothetical protein